MDNVGRLRTYQLTLAVTINIPGDIFFKVEQLVAISKLMNVIVYWKTTNIINVLTRADITTVIVKIRIVISIVIIKIVNQ